VQVPNIDKYDNVDCGINLRKTVKSMTNKNVCYIQLICYAVLPSSTYLLTVGVEGFWFFIWSHSSTHHSRYDSSAQGISPSQRPLPDNTNTHKRQTSMPSVGSEPSIPASARPQTYALDCAATGIGPINMFGF
jgi:hypothetical protein